ncbi:MAG TPA: serine hydrolase [Thermoanaerobaculia bacterium]|jgi:CubicO group peptidase (beta-lactamase class C family)|nr:serine hydrolase [Thermoanaerobaculia bacterium]
MKRLFVAILLSFSLVAKAATPTTDEIQKILVDRIDAQRQSVGIVVGIIDADGRRIVSHGHLDAKGKRAVDGNTLFEIGSVTKVFTSLLLADAVARGEVALTDPVAKYLPATVKVPERGGKKITLQDLATHTSALPRLPANLTPANAENPYADYTVAQMYDFLSKYELSRDIGAQYEYSNLGAGLLGHALARRAGKDYETLVRERITAPLAMKSTTVAISEALKPRLASGHDAQLQPAANWDLPTLAGAGALRSSANDMLTFLAAFLGYEKSPLAPAMASMLTTRKPTGNDGLKIALGWHVASKDGREIVWHNGGTGGYRSFIGFDPKSRTGVVVLSNAATAAGPDDIGRHLLDRDSPLAESPKQVAADAKTFDHFVGRYELAPNFVMTVTREGEQLFVQLTGQPKFEIFPKGDREFFLKVVEARITFEPDVDGRAPALVLHQNGRDMPAKRIEGEAPAPKERKEIAVDPAVLERYVGRYQLTPDFVIAITREQNALFLQATAQPKFPIFAESERDFFLKALDAQITFVVDAEGRATQLVLHQFGVDQTAKRVD